MKKHAIAIFVSGRGSNARAIIEQQIELNYTVALLVVSSEKAAALSLAKTYDIPYLVLNKSQFLAHDANLIESLAKHQITLIALAGFLWKVPSYLIASYPNQILNIHPALLPKYGGKGMYGMRIHEAVYQNKETTTGVTIHLVNEKYDDGKILLQKEVAINVNDTPSSIAEKVLMLEHECYAKAIATYLKKKFK